MKKRFIKITVLGIILVGCAFLLGYRFNENERASVNDGFPIAFAHRGVKNYYCENSAESYRHADKLGFGALEVDVSITRDNVPIVFHDENGKRLLGVDRSIDEMNYSDVKDEYLHFKGEKTSNKIMTLNHFFERFKDGKIVYLDVKTPSKIIADSIVYLVDKYQQFNSTLIADANILFLAYLKHKDSRILTVLEGFGGGKEWVYYLIPHLYRPDFYASFLSQVDESHVSFLKRNKLIDRKIVYGVDNTNLQKAIDLSMRNVIIDYDSSMIDANNIVRLLQNEGQH